MLLTVKDRLILLQLLPEQGDITTLKLVRQLREDLSFDEEELERLQMRNADGRIVWEAGGETEKEVEFGPRATALVVRRLEELDASKELRLELLDICERFGFTDA